MKKSLLLLHGALGTASQFEGLKDHLEEDFVLHTFNFEGHGGIATSSEYSIKLFAKNALDFIQSNNIEQTHVFGYSMGGYVGLYLARFFPDVVKRVATLGTKFSWTAEIAAKEVKMLSPDAIEQKVPMFAKKLSRDHAPLNWKNVLEGTAKMMLDLGAGNGLSQNDFTKIEHQVLLGLGAEDKMVTLEETNQVANWLPNANLQILEGVPHPLEKADPKVVAQFIKNAF